MQAARLDIQSGQELRGALRFTIDAPSTLRVSDAVPMDVRIANFSRTGFLMIADIALEMDMTVNVGLAGAGVREARVARSDPRGYGCEFITPLTHAEMAAAFANRDGAVVTLAPAEERRTRAEAEEERAWRLWASVALLLVVAELMVIVVACLLLLR